MGSSRDDLGMDFAHDARPAASRSQSTFSVQAASGARAAATRQRRTRMPRSLSRLGGSWIRPLPPGAADLPLLLGLALVLLLRLLGFRRRDEIGRASCRERV